MQTKELKNKIKARIDYYKKEIKREDNSIRSTNYHMYLEKLSLYKDLLIIVGTKDDLEKEKLDILSGQLDFIDNLKML